MDVLMVARADDYDFLFGEMNYVPGLYMFGERVNVLLEDTHRQMLADLWELAQAPNPS